MPAAVPRITCAGPRREPTRACSVASVKLAPGVRTMGSRAKVKPATAARDTRESPSLDRLSGRLSAVPGIVASSASSVMSMGARRSPGADAAPRRRRGLSPGLAIRVAVLLVAGAGASVSGSLALLADAGHMLTDAAGLSLA